MAASVAGLLFSPAMPIRRSLRSARSRGFRNYRVSGRFRELAHMTRRSVCSTPKPASDILGPMKNGLYSVHMHMLDGVRGRDSGVLILRDGRFLGGGPYFWSEGSYTCGPGTSGKGTWKGELRTK